MARKTKNPDPISEPAIIQFETFNNPGRWIIDRLRQEHPAVFNGNISVRKYRITIELIEEPAEVLQQRLQKLWNEASNMHHWDPLRAEATRLGLKLETGGFGRRKGTGP